MPRHSQIENSLLALHCHTTGRTPDWARASVVGEESSKSTWGFIEACKTTMACNNQCMTLDPCHKTARLYWNPTCPCVGIHLGRVEPVSPIDLTTLRTEAAQARRSCASAQETFTQPFLHRVQPKICGPERGSRPALVVVAHIFSGPPVSLRHVRGGAGRSRSLPSSPSECLAV